MLPSLSFAQFIASFHNSNNDVSVTNHSMTLVRFSLTQTWDQYLKLGDASQSPRRNFSGRTRLNETEQRHITFKAVSETSLTGTVLILN